VKKSAKLNRKRPMAHMLVVRTINNTQMEIAERQCIVAFTHGVARSMHFDLLLRVMNMLLVAGQTDPARKYALDYAQDKIKPVLSSIRERFEKTNKLGVNGEELSALKHLIEFNREFWKHQTGELFVFCYDQVDEFYADIEQKKAAA
jgi:hypothetical protein